MASTIRAGDTPVMDSFNRPFFLWKYTVADTAKRKQARLGRRETAWDLGASPIFNQAPLVTSPIHTSRHTPALDDRTAACPSVCICRAGQLRFSR